MDQAGGRGRGTRKKAVATSSTNSKRVERGRRGAWQAFVALTIWLKFNKLYEMLSRVGNAVGQRRWQRCRGRSDLAVPTTSIFSDNDVDMAMDEVRRRRWQLQAGNRGRD